MSKPEIDVNKVFNAVQMILGTQIPQVPEQSPTENLFHAAQKNGKDILQISNDEYAALRKRQNPAQGSVFDF